MTEPYIDLDLANGTYRFALPMIAQVRIEQQCRATFGAVVARVMRGRYAVNEFASTGLITEAEFGARDLDVIIREGLVAGGWANLPGHPNYVMEHGDVIGWFYDKYSSKWTIEQKWTLAAAVIGAMFYGQPAATNLPKDGGVIIESEDGGQDQGGQGAPELAAV